MQRNDGVSLLRGRLRILVGLLAIFCEFISFGSFAQPFPSKPVRLVVPNAPGGGTDILARLLAQKLQEIWNQSVIVEYKPGAGTVTGTEFVGRAAPDGLTLLMSVSSHMINPSLRNNLPYDTLRDFSAVSITAIAHTVITATPSLPINTLSDLISLAKKQPGALGYATAGAGSGLHMTGELLKMTTGIDIVHVPYKGSGPAFPDVIAGRVQLMIDPLFSALPYIKAGKLKPIAIASRTRAANTPDIPTIAETLPGFVVTSTNGIIAPSATPRPVIAKISSDLAVAVRYPDIRARMAEIGLEPVGSTPEEFDALIRSEIERWAKVVKFSGAKAE
ncbi:MAG: tripartite tricarboxylate transporter substrate binding protein [Burkholderiales bacterium]